MNWSTFFKVWLAWVSVGLAHALSRYTDIVKYGLNVPFSYMETLGFVVTYSQWLVITLILLRFLRSFAYPFSYLSIGSLFFIGLLCWLPFYITADYVLSTFISDNQLSNLATSLANTRGTVVFFYAVIYVLTFAACLGVVLADKTREAQDLNTSLLQQKTQAELKLSEQRMQLMQSQLSPHVLFNCLGAISSLARNGQRVAIIEAVAMVGNLLRFTILNSPVKTITIYDELSFVKDYIELQRLRFEDRFSYESDIAGDIDEDIMCPPFTMQPLLENAFHHAVELTEKEVSIRMTVSQSGGRVHFHVHNTIPERGKTEHTTGTGLTNLRNRLEHLYGENFSFDTYTDETQFRVDLSIPVKAKTHAV